MVHYLGQPCPRELLAVIGSSRSVLSGVATSLMGLLAPGNCVTEKLNVFHYFFFNGFTHSKSKWKQPRMAKLVWI